jgi:NADH-quinone oxidoreductase subunit I
MIEKKVREIKVDFGVVEKSYWVEILRGLWITNKHFMVNMKGHILRAFGLKPQSEFSATIQYPEVLRPIHHRWRGRHRLTVKQNGDIRCTSCMMCETICPCDCIHIVPGESADPTVEKFPEEFCIDVLRCCFCGLCEEACPVDAIRMDVMDFNLAGYTRDIVFDKEFLMGISDKRAWEKWDVFPSDSKGSADAA